MFKSIGRCLINTFKFEGRTDRKDFLRFTAFCAVLLTAFYFIFMTSFADKVESSGTFIKCCAEILRAITGISSYSYLMASVRRLHDIGKSGLWVLLNLICIVGSVILFVMMLKKGDSGHNKYGVPPELLNGSRIEKKLKNIK